MNTKDIQLQDRNGLNKSDTATTLNYIATTMQQLEHLVRIPKTYSWMINIGSLQDTTTHCNALHTLHNNATQCNRIAMGSLEIEGETPCDGPLNKTE